MALPIRAGDEDLTKYLVLRDSLPIKNPSAPWFETWDEYESSGMLLPLLIHTSNIAFRKGIQNVHPGATGYPDLSDVWLETRP